MNTSTGEKRAVIVTGVSSGIGLAIAEDLLQHGYQVFGSVRKSADGEALVKQWSDSFVPLIFDVTDAAALFENVDRVKMLLNGRSLTAIVNNAGIGMNGPLMHQPMAEIRLMFEVNVFGMLEVTRAFLPLLGRRGKAQRPGRIVNISSVQGRITIPFMGAYSASKHALEALTQALRRELKIYGIEASAIEPGTIRSSIFEKVLATNPTQRYTDTDFAAWWQQFNRSMVEAVALAKSPDVVTRAVRHAIESDKPRTRYSIDFLGSVFRLLSDRVFDRLVFKMTGLDRLNQHHIDA
jgi:NAD(P)-dependent dehydrogenase (short-subunit alcohol dehydrogenase family)